MEPVLHDDYPMSSLSRLASVMRHGGWRGQHCKPTEEFASGLHQRSDEVAPSVDRGRR